MRLINRGIPYKRKREGKTDYIQRRTLVISGRPRLVVRPSLKNVLVQVVEYYQDGDKVVASAHSNELTKKFSYRGTKRNTSAAYLVGMLAATKALKKGTTEAVLDIGLKKSTKGALVFAALNGAIDAGLKIPHSPKIFPSKERIEGKHLKTIPNFDDVKSSILKMKPMEVKIDRR